MDMYSIVRPEHLNHHGHLFGGKLLSWVDENAWLAATRDFPSCILVTRAVDHVDFNKPIPCGAILRFAIELKEKGVTSLQYMVTVYATLVGSAREEQVFSTRITFVNIDAGGHKWPIALQ